MAHLITLQNSDSLLPQTRLRWGWGGAIEQNDEKLNGTKVRTKESFPNTFTGMCIQFDGIKTNDREKRERKKD